MADVTLAEVHGALRETIVEVRGLKEQLGDLKGGADERAKMRERIAVLEEQRETLQRAVDDLKKAAREEERRKWWESLLLPVAGVGGTGGTLVTIWQLIQALQ